VVSITPARAGVHATIEENTRASVASVTPAKAGVHASIEEKTRASVFP
jgi:hypothetical protein